MKYMGVVTDINWFNKDDECIIGGDGYYICKYGIYKKDICDKPRIYSDEIPMADVDKFKYRNFMSMCPISPEESNILYDNIEKFSNW